MRAEKESVLTNPPPLIGDDLAGAPTGISHRIIGSRIRPPANEAVISKAIKAAMAAGLSEDIATTLAHAAADLQQLRRALTDKKTQRFGTEEFTYIEVDTLMFHVISSPDNIRFEEDHARGTIGLPRFSSVPGQAMLTLAMNSASELISAMAPRILDMSVHNPHITSIKHRGIETPGWLSFVKLTTEHGDVIRLETTDGFGRSVGAHEGLGITFADAAFNLLPGSRRARSLHAQIAKLGTFEQVTETEAQMVRCALMPNARIIIDSNTHPFHVARRHFVAHLHMAPPMAFSTATMLNAKANAAVDKLADLDLLPALNGLSSDEVRGIFDGNTSHSLFADELAVLACSVLNPNHKTRRGRAVSEAIVDLTGIAPEPKDRALIAAEVALRGFPNDSTLIRRRSALERAWRLADLRGVEPTLRAPEEILADALVHLVQEPDKVSPARSELAVLATYHLVTAKEQLLLRSEHGAREGATEPTKVIGALSRSSAGLRQLCQIVLDGRANRAMQRLPEGAEPADKIMPDAEVLTPGMLREFAEHQPLAGVLFDTPEQQYAAAIGRFQAATDSLHAAAEAVANVCGADGEPLVELRGYYNQQVRDTLAGVSDLLTVWRSTYDKRERQRVKDASPAESEW